MSLSPSQKQTSGDAAIVVENLHKSFKDGRYRVLQGIDVSFARGQLTYVLGPSGTGKSVLLKHVLGLLHPERGRVLVEGVEVGKLGPSDLPAFRTRFGVLFQNSALFDSMSVFENVAFPLREHTKLSEREIRSRAEGALTKLGMEAGFDKLPSELSGGMKKRVALARAIIREPSILLYDEPTTGLDPVTRTTVDELIGQLKDELHLTSVVISHDLPSALMLADHIVFLYGGKVAYSGEPAGLRKAKHPVIQDVLRAEERMAKAMA
ncbi:MAG: ATP-binding cassette domain-containing protein [Bdellovibrionales bacterium]|nr:ATP-binding cassette domain-containing protein [Bdellovibrionales bacterium]